ncbi:MAG: hypothetical protein ACM359_03660, partial [Bacillota bacterium]
VDSYRERMEEQRRMEEEQARQTRELVEALKASTAATYELLERQKQQALSNPAGNIFGGRL